MYWRRTHFRIILRKILIAAAAQLPELVSTYAGITAVRECLMALPTTKRDEDAREPSIGESTARGVFKQAVNLQ